MADTLGVLFSNESSTGNGDWIDWPGGTGTLFVDGTFGGTTLTVEREEVGAAGSGVDLGSDYTFTAEGQVNLNIAACRLRGVLTGGVPAGVYAKLVRM